MSATERLDAIEARANAATDDIGIQYSVPANEWLMSCDKPTMQMLRHAPQDVPDLVVALRAALAIHEPVAAINYGVRNPNVTRVCAGCGQDDGNWSIWPCRTIRAIEGALT